MSNKVSKVVVRTLIVLLIALQGTLFGAKSQHTGDWKFTEHDFRELSHSQKEIIKKSYWIGKSYGLGNILAAISIVETRAGAFPDKSKNRICGAHQVDVNVVKENLGTETSPKRLCKALQDNPVLSAIVSLEILLYWKEHSKNAKEMLNKYNRGWEESPHDDEYYRRIQMVLKVLKANSVEEL